MLALLVAFTGVSLSVGLGETMEKRLGWQAGPCAMLAYCGVFASLWLAASLPA